MVRVNMLIENNPKWHKHSSFTGESINQLVAPFNICSGNFTRISKFLCTNHTSKQCSTTLKKVDEGILSDLTVQPYAPIELKRPASSVNLHNSFSEQAE